MGILPVEIDEGRLSSVGFVAGGILRPRRRRGSFCGPLVCPSGLGRVKRAPWMAGPESPPEPVRWVPPSREEMEGESKVTTVERVDSEKSFDTVLQELTAIQQDGPRNVAILGTRHTSYLHQQIVELLSFANVLVGNHVFTSGAGGTNAAVIRGAIRAEKPDLLTVVLPQSLWKQPPDARDHLERVQQLIEMKENDDLPLDVASRLCNSDILSRCTHFIAFAFHDSEVLLEAVREAKALNMIVTLLYLD
uniref:DNA recombination-mediator protein A n=1 Tax=Compsopogon caeruleus TaxID=31354 RepID=A0A7S1T552_9RHOD|mmetsp:Transcript_10724/g.21545  ORF Transcript_10724/g.21545 Transcript_10724/m.21545 type:complete len:249 (+) Transcript_10724:118-864(+)